MTSSTSTLFEFQLPDIGEGIAEGELLAWLVQPGDSVTEDQPLFEVMTDKVTVEIPSPVAGIVKDLRFEPGQQVPVGEVIITLETAGDTEVTQKATPATTAEALKKPTVCNAASQPAMPSQASLPPVTERVPVLAAPATRALAREHAIDLKTVAGTGPNGRVTRSDLEQALSTAPPASVAPPAPALTRSIPASPAPAAEDSVLPYTGVRRVIGDRMMTSHQSIPPFALVEKLTVTELVRLRDKLKPMAAQRGVERLTYLPFILKALSQAFQVAPALNARLDEARQQIIRFGSLNINIAMETPQGLVVPVIRGVEQKGLLQLATELNQLQAQGLAGKLAPQAMEGGHFTVTSLGALGGLLGIPVVAPGQAAILGVHAIKQEPVVQPDGSLGVGQIMHLSVSADHRLVDGADAGRFLRSLKEQLEAPESLLL